MEANKILTADVLDIIFDGRNKTYGAYELRRTYNKRLWTALITMASVCLFVVVGGLIAKNASKKAGPVIVQDVQLEEIKTEKPPEVPPPPPPKMPEPPKIEMAKFTPPKIVKDKEVKPDEKPPEVEKLDETKIGTVNQEGEKDKGITAPPVEKPTTTEPVKPVEDYNKVYTKVENPAAFPGGPAAWKRYLESNLRADAVVDAGAPTGILTVRVQFIVDRDGNISDVKALNDPGFGTAEEAVRVIKKGPKWKPALQNGRNVTYQAMQGVSFNIQSE